MIELLPFYLFILGVMIYLTYSAFKEKESIGRKILLCLTTGLFSVPLFILFAFIMACYDSRCFG